MGSRHTERIAQVKAELLGRLRQGYHRSGQAFLSNRAVVRRFGISYQTAHRIMAELAEEGWLRRSGGSGTYLQGKVTNWKGIELIFGERARRRGRHQRCLRHVPPLLFSDSDLSRLVFT